MCTVDRLATYNCIITFKCNISYDLIPVENHWDESQPKKARIPTIGRWVCNSLVFQEFVLNWSFCFDFSPEIIYFYKMAAKNVTWPCCYGNTALQSSTSYNKSCAQLSEAFIAFARYKKLIQPNSVCEPGLNCAEMNKILELAFCRGVFMRKLQNVRPH